MDKHNPHHVERRHYLRYTMEITDHGKPSGETGFRILAPGGEPVMWGTVTGKTELIAGRNKYSRLIYMLMAVIDTLPHLDLREVSPE